MNPTDTLETFPGALPTEIEGVFQGKATRCRSISRLPGDGIKGLTNHLRVLVGRRHKRG